MCIEIIIYKLIYIVLINILLEKLLLSLCIILREILFKILDIFITITFVEIVLSLFNTLAMNLVILYKDIKII